MKQSLLCRFLKDEENPKPNKILVKRGVRRLSRIGRHNATGLYDR